MLFSSSFLRLPSLFVFFFNDTATTEIYTLSLHDALPIRTRRWKRPWVRWISSCAPGARCTPAFPDRKSTRLNSSHLGISYAVFCLKKKKIKNINTNINRQDESYGCHELVVIRNA